MAWGRVKGKRTWHVVPHAPCPTPKPSLKQRAVEKKEKKAIDKKTS
jgi:hypothetical protein